MNAELTATERQLFAEACARHKLWVPDAEPIVLARGAENTTFALGDLIVRLSDQRDVQAHEVAVLCALAGAVTVPIPAPLLHDPELGLFAYRRLPGMPLLHRTERESPTIERGLVEVLRALRTVDAARRLPVDCYPNEDWHHDAIHGFRVIRSHLRASQAQLVQRFLADAPPPTRATVVPQHNDLGAEHILVDADGTLTGIIDWTDAAQTDPARDIGSLYRDLGRDTAFRISEALGQPVTDDEHARFRFHARCRWIEDVCFGLREPATRQAYLANAWRTFDHTFSRSP